MLLLLIPLSELIPYLGVLQACNHFRVQTVRDIRDIRASQIACEYIPSR